jgi:hypothetical protein
MVKQNNIFPWSPNNWIFLPLKISYGLLHNQIHPMDMAIYKCKDYLSKKNLTF